MLTVLLRTETAFRGPATEVEVKSVSIIILAPLLGVTVIVVWRVTVKLHLLEVSCKNVNVYVARSRPYSAPAFTAKLSTLNRAMSTG